MPQAIMVAVTMLLAIPAQAQPKDVAVLLRHERTLGRDVSRRHRGRCGAA